MKIHPTSFGIAGIGLFIIIVATIRWLFMHPDLSQFLIAGLIGGGFIILGYVHFWMREADSRFEKTNSRIDAMLKWALKEDWKDEKE